MFTLNYVIAFTALIITFITYKYIEYNNAQAVWGDGVKGLHLQLALKNLLALESGDNQENEQLSYCNWRPQMIACVEVSRGNNYENLFVVHDHLISTLELFKKSNCLSLVMSVTNDVESKEHIRNYLRSQLRLRHMRSFVHVVDAPTVFQGVDYSLQSLGLGVLQPNTILLGFPSADSIADDYVTLVKRILKLKKVLLVCKLPVIASPQTTTIDVYWIVHDGGILVLLAYLLKKHRIWKRCKLRIFCIAQLEDNSILIEKELKRSVQQLRIDADVRVLELGDYDISEFTYERTLRMKERGKLLERMKLRSDSFSFKVDGKKGERFVKLEKLRARKSIAGVKVDIHELGRMNTAVKVNELIRDTSKDASCVFCNLPRVDGMESSDWLEYMRVMINGLDRVILVKGSGMEVIGEIAK